MFSSDPAYLREAERTDHTRDSNWKRSTCGKGGSMNRRPAGAERDNRQALASARGPGDRTEDLVPPYTFTSLICTTG